MVGKPKKIGPETPAGDAAAAILESKARKMFSLEKAAASGTDADAVHDMRVASRRLRASMGIFEPLYRRKPFRKWHGMGRGVTKSLGKVRDADVFIEAFRRLAKKRSLTEGQRIAIAYVIGRRQGERARDVARLNKRLEKMDLAAAQTGFSRFVRDFRKSPLLEAPLYEFARDAIPQRLERALGHVPAALVPENSAEQHAMRLDFKQLRYAIETLSPCFDDDVDEVIALTKEFQDALGELHDYDVFIDAVCDIHGSSDARAAGVDDASLEGVLRLLQAERDKRFGHFRFLIRRNGQPMLRSLILGSLQREPGETPSIGDEHPGIGSVCRERRATDVAAPGEAPDEALPDGRRAASAAPGLVRLGPDVRRAVRAPGEPVDMPIPEESVPFGRSPGTSRPAESP